MFWIGSRLQELVAHGGSTIFQDFDYWQLNRRPLKGGLTVYRVKSHDRVE